MCGPITERDMRLIYEHMCPDHKYQINNLITTRVFLENLFSMLLSITVLDVSSTRSAFDYI